MDVVLNGNKFGFNMSKTIDLKPSDFLADAKSIKGNAKLFFSIDMVFKHGHSGQEGDLFQT